MKSEVATDIYQTCLMMRRRVARIVQAKSFSNVDIESVAELLSIIDYIDTKLEAYKKQYLKLKNKTLKEIQKKKNKMDQEEAKNQDEDEGEDSEGQRKKKKKSKKNKRKQKSESQSEEEEEDQRQHNQEESKQKEAGGFKKLAAPPTSKSHVIQNLQRLKEKLKQEQRLETGEDMDATNPQSREG